MKISILEWGKSIARVSAKRRIPNGVWILLRSVSYQRRRKKVEFPEYLAEFRVKETKEENCPWKKKRKKEREESVASLTERELENIYRLENKISGRKEKNYSTIVSCRHCAIVQFRKTWKRYKILLRNILQKWKVNRKKKKNHLEFTRFIIYEVF